MEVKFRVVVLASGRGSNFCAIADAITSHQLPNAEIIGLVSNRADAKALQEAEKRSIPKFLIEAKQFRKDHRFDRNAYEKELLKLLKSLKPDLILLAGYMLVLGKEIVSEFPQQIINIHPSLLPKFRGLHAQKQALDHGEKETGCTVHWVTEGLDEGDPILQAKVPILTGDTEETLSARLLPVEHATYVSALKMLTKK